jgi:VanZ family protein
MATPAVQFFPYQTPLQRPSYRIWIPVLIGLSIICCESTPAMGGNETGKWLSEIWPAILGKVDTNFIGTVNQALRKVGHFTGYGILGLFLLKAWHRSVRTYMKMMGGQLIFAGSALSVSFTFLVGSLDEWHQKFMPGRVSSCRDVLIDTSGALLFNLIFWLVRYLRRRSLLREKIAETPYQFNSVGSGYPAPSRRSAAVAKIRSVRTASLPARSLRSQ